MIAIYAVVKIFSAFLHGRYLLRFVRKTRAGALPQTGPLEGLGAGPCPDLPRVSRD